MIIQHLAIENEWAGPEVVENPKTIILGSFNPFDPNINRNTDYYYGRSTNHFWKSIARNLNLHEDYFCNNCDRKFEVMNKYQFCFQDIIDSLNIKCENQAVLLHFINNKILAGYSDSTIFKSQTMFENEIITIRRNYNSRILEVLNNGTLNKIIHTMGNNRINQNLIVKPLENNLGLDGFSGFFQNIINNCNLNNIEINPISFSPSGRAVNAGDVNYRNNLDNWINDNLLI